MPFQCFIGNADAQIIGHMTHQTNAYAAQRDICWVPPAKLLLSRRVPCPPPVELVRYLRGQNCGCPGTARDNGIRNPPLKSIEETEKKAAPRGDVDTLAVKTEGQQNGHSAVNRRGGGADVLGHQVLQ